MPTSIQLDPSIARRIRQDRGWSQTELARRLAALLDTDDGPTPESLLRMVQRWEQFGRPSEGWATRLARVYDIQIGQLQSDFAVANGAAWETGWLICNSFKGGSNSGAIYRNLESLAQAIYREIDRWQIDADDGDQLQLTTGSDASVLCSIQGPFGSKLYIRRIRIGAPREQEAVVTTDEERSMLARILQPILFHWAPCVVIDGERFPYSLNHFHYTLEFDPPRQDSINPSKVVWTEEEARERIEAWFIERPANWVYAFELNSGEPLVIYRRGHAGPQDSRKASYCDSLKLDRRCLGSQGQIVASPWPEIHRDRLLDALMESLANIPGRAEYFPPLPPEVAAQGYERTSYVRSDLECCGARSPEA